MSAERAGRAYTRDQMQAIAARQDERNALSTRIAYDSGVRAHELLTLRPAGEAQPSGHRTWHEERFSGRDGVRYVVEGKGGLRCEVSLSQDLAARLEAHRLESPGQVTDRGVHYSQHYEIGGGTRGRYAGAGRIRRKPTSRGD